MATHWGTRTLVGWQSRYWLPTSPTCPCCEGREEQAPFFQASMRMTIWRLSGATQRGGKEAWEDQSVMGLTWLQ